MHISLPSTVLALAALTQAATPLRPNRILKRQSSSYCPSSYESCGDNCMPIGDTCCSDGTFCFEGYDCTTGSDGEGSCCPSGETCDGPGGTSSYYAGGFPTISVPDFSSYSVPYTTSSDYSATPLPTSDSFTDSFTDTFTDSATSSSSSAVRTPVFGGDLPTNSPVSGPTLGSGAGSGSGGVSSGGFGNLGGGAGAGSMVMPIANGVAFALLLAATGALLL